MEASSEAIQSTKDSKKKGLLFVILGMVGILLLSFFFYRQSRYDHVNKSNPAITKTPSATTVLEKRIMLLADMSNRGAFADIYDTFFSPEQKELYTSYAPNYRENYLNSIEQYYKLNRISHISFNISTITIKDDKAYVERTLKICYDTSCKNNSSEKSTVEWYRENTIWYTTQEQPLCERKPPFNLSSSVDGKTKKIEPKSGIELIWQIECGMFPIYDTDPPINTTLSEISPDEVHRAVDILENAFAKYPPRLLKYFLRKVYLLGSLNILGADYGGTYAARSLYLTDKGIDHGYTDLYIEQSFHHEFSSLLLLLNDPYYVKDLATWENPTWASFNNPQFVYGTGGAQEIKEGKSSRDFDTDFNAKGFLNQYSTSSMENDFNEIAMNLFESSGGFWDIVNSNPTIRKKTQFVIDFYHQLDPLFTEEYFKGLSPPSSIPQSMTSL